MVIRPDHDLSLIIMIQKSQVQFRFRIRFIRASLSATHSERAHVNSAEVVVVLEKLKILHDLAL
jgi:hypothetical protein